MTITPMQYGAAGEVRARVDQRHAGHDPVGVAGPVLDRRIGPPDPVAICGVDVHRSVEGPAPLSHRAVEVRMADGDRADPAQLLDPGGDLVIEVAHAIPQHIARR
jgi:hypothetical protein